jgi:hypothetical protein
VVDNKEYPRVLVQIADQLVAYCDSVAFTPHVKIAFCVKPFLDDVAALSVRCVRPCIVAYFLLLQQLAG